MRNINVKELRALIADLPDNTPVLVTASDHSYRRTSACVTTAIYDRNAGWMEDWEGVDDEEEGPVKRATVLVIGR